MSKELIFFSEKFFSLHQISLFYFILFFRLGGTVAATFCILTTLMKQLDYDLHADVSIYAKLYHNRIPGIWKTIVSIDVQLIRLNLQHLGNLFRLKTI